MRMTPLRRRHLRSILVAVLATSAISVILAGFSFNQSANQDIPSQLISGSGHVTASIDDAMFTSEELRYLRYGEGDLAVAEDDPRYMAFIRSHMSRPANNLPLRLANKSGHTDFSQVR